MVWQSCAAECAKQHSSGRGSQATDTSRPFATESLRPDKSMRENAVKTTLGRAILTLDTRWSVFGHLRTRPDIPRGLGRVQ
jgi:hypothetical protein